MGKEVKANSYSNLKPVYSIWLCMNVEEDCLLLSELTDINIYGKCKFIDRTNFIHLAFVGLRNIKDKNEYCESLSHKILNVVFSRRISNKEKYDFLVDNKVMMSKEMEDDLSMMDSLESELRDEVRDEVKDDYIRLFVETLCSMLTTDKEIISLLIDKFKLSVLEAENYFNKYSTR